MANFGDALAGVAVGFASAVSDPALKQKREEKRTATGISRTIANDFRDTPYADQAQLEFLDSANNKNTRKMHTALYNSYASGAIDIFHKDDPLAQDRKVKSYPGATNFVFSPKLATPTEEMKNINAHNALLTGVRGLATKKFNTSDLTNLNPQQRGELVRIAIKNLNPTQQKRVSQVAFGKGINSQQTLREKIGSNIGYLTTGFDVLTGATTTTVTAKAREQFGETVDIYTIANSTQVSNAMYALLVDATNNPQGKSADLLEKNNREADEITQAIQNSIANTISETSESVIDKTLTPALDEYASIADIMDDNRFSVTNLSEKLPQIRQTFGENATNEQIAYRLTQQLIPKISSQLAQNDEVFQQIQVILFDRLEQADVDSNEKFRRELLS